MTNKKLIKLLTELANNPDIKSITVNWTGTSPDMKPVIVITKK
jgi:hypothetical protein